MSEKNLIENEEITIESDEVVNKYQMAADVSNRMCCYIFIETSALLEYWKM